MNNDDKYFYPITPEVLHNYAESIFVPIRRGESITSVWVPMTGRRMWNKFIIENINLFGKELPHFEKYLLVYVEPLDLTEESITGYLRLMGRSFIEVCKKNQFAKEKINHLDTNIFDDPTAQYSKLLDGLRKLLFEITNSGLEVIFFLGEFDELTFASKMFHNNLKSLWSNMYPRVHYLFLNRTPVEEPHKILLWGDLTEALLQNVVYIPIHKDDTIEYLLDYFANFYNTKFSGEERKILRHLCGGHSYMLKVASRFVSLNRGENLENRLRYHYELFSIAETIFNTRTQQEKDVLIKIVKHEQIEDVNREVLEFLESLGLVLRDKKGELNVFCKLVEDAIVAAGKSQKQNTHIEQEINYDQEKSAIVLNGVPIDEKFTHQEHEVLVLFLMKKDIIVKREEVGDILWGKESYDKYSDWAIDQLMSKLRKKLGVLGSKSTIATLRGRGYKLLIP